MSPRFVVKQEETHLLKQQLKEIKQRSLKLRGQKFMFLCEDAARQVFWLNIVNYMTLQRMAELALLKPQVLRSLNGYASWQTFWDTTKIHITNEEFSVSKILFSMLRQHQSLPDFSVIMPEKTPYELLPASVRDLVVTEPCPFNFYGVFVPCKNFPPLQVFEPSMLHTQLD